MKKFYNTVQSVAGYLDDNAGCVAVPNRSEQPGYAKLQKTVCGTWAVISECPDGHHNAKALYCGREWCEICGALNSPAHKRRIARVLPKAQQIKSMGYFVIEFPDAYRKLGAGGLYPDDINGSAWCYSKKDLRDSTNRIVKVLAGKRTASRRRVGGYFKRGLLRWHWFGDKVEGKYNPHANVLVESGYLKKDKLKEIKNALRQELVCPELIVNYYYCDNPGQMYNKVEYITRATFLNKNWSPYMASELYNFRNQRWWGGWNDKPEWTIESSKDINIPDILAVSKLQQNICWCGKHLKALKHNLKTGKPVYWTRPIDKTYLLLWNARELAGAGYYQIPEQSLTGHDIIMLSRPEIKRRGNNAEHNRIHGIDYAGGNSDGEISADENNTVDSEGEKD